MKIKFKPNTSEKSNHKYTAILDNRKVKFGDKRYQQFHDKIGFFSYLDHNDEKKRKLYKKRHGKITDSSGKPFYRIKYSPSWFSWNYLW